MPAHAAHHEHVVSGALAPWVEAVVGYELTGFPAGVHVGMPSGSLTLVISLDGPLILSDPRGGPRAHQAVLAGLSPAPTFIHHDGHQVGLQLALRPGAARALLGCPAAEIADGSFELCDVLGRDADRLRDQLGETESWDERFRVLDTLLLARLRQVAAPGPGRGAGPGDEVAEAWRLIRRSGGRVAISEVASRVGWSSRHLQQRFAREFGLAPKTLARISRFERSVPLVAGRATPLADVAALCGYTDQAHLTREWRALAGTSPARWRTADVLAQARDDEEPAQRHTA